MEIIPGRVYKHYKGNHYLVEGVGKNSETLEDVVVYRALYSSKDFGPGMLWVRPQKMFLELVEIDGNFIPRFELTDDSQSAAIISQYLVVE